MVTNIMNALKQLLQDHTTSQMVYKLRKNYYDEDILIMASECSKGVYDAVSSIMNKQVSSTRYSSEEREVTETNE